MHRYFIAFVVIATVAITAVSAAPARASDRDLARVLAGLAALAVIGKAIHDRNKNDRKDRVTQSYVAPRQHALNPRPLPDRVARKTLPAQCLRDTRGPNGHTRRVLSARCLDRNFSYSRDLPRGCARQIETQRGWRWAYGARCLRNNGYQIARHR